jgi:hypothetical protein
MFTSPEKVGYIFARFFLLPPSFSLFFDPSCTLPLLLSISAVHPSPFVWPHPLFLLFPCTFPQTFTPLLAFFSFRVFFSSLLEDGPPGSPLLPSYWDCSPSAPTKLSLLFFSFCTFQPSFTLILPFYHLEEFLLEAGFWFIFYCSPILLQPPTKLSLLFLSFFYFQPSFIPHPPLPSFGRVLDEPVEVEDELIEMWI